ncbi:MAG TPA: hypothetical protein VIT92_17375, partial [Burkholderiaceae bacterium]
MKIQATSFRPRRLAAFAVAILASSIAQAAVTAPQAGSDATNVSYQLAYSGSPSYTRLYLDTDRKTASGYASGGVGADFMLENGNLYRYTGAGGTAWGWALVKAVTYTKSTSSVRWAFARADLGPTSAIDLVGQIEAPVETTAKVTQTLSTASATPALPVVSSTATTSTYVLTHASSVSTVRLFLDTDKNAATGYSNGGLGANYLIENGSLYRYAGTGGTAWGWTLVRAGSLTRTATGSTTTIARGDIGATTALNFITQTEAPVVNSPLMSQTLTAATDPIP